MRAPVRQSGVTLVELVVSIVVVSIAASALLGVLSIVSIGSADAMIRHQAVAIANAYLDEAMLKSFQDPDGVTESSRADFDDINDYHGLDDTGARNQLGTALAGLESYRVQVTVGTGTLGAIGATDVRRIDVTVRHPSGIAMTVSGYRTSAL